VASLIPLETLRAKLASQPPDEATLAAFEEACTEADDLEALRDGFLDAARGADAATVRHLLARVAALLERRAEAAEPGEAAEAWLRVGRAHVAADGAPGQAAAAFAKAWRDAAHPGAVAAARKLVRPANGDASDTPEPAFLLRARAAFAEEALGEGGVERPWEAEVESLQALHALAARALDAQALDRAESLYERLVALRPEDPRIKGEHAKVRALRATRRKRLAALDRAASKAPKHGPKGVKAWTDLGLALAAEGDDEHALKAFERAMAAGDAPRAEEGFEQVMRRAGRLEALAEAWRARLERRPGAPRLSPSREIDLRRKLHRLLTEELARPQEAMAQVQVRRPPRPEDVAPTLEEARALGAAGKWESAVQLLDEAARGATTRKARLALTVERARILDEELGDAARAEKAYGHVRLLDPRSLEALTFYRRWHAQREEWQKHYATLSQLYARHAQRGDEARDERVALAREMAAVAEQRLEDPDRAADAWRKVLRDLPLDGEADAALRRLYTEGERWHALVEHLEGLIAARGDGAPEEVTRLLFEIIEIYQDPERLDLEDMVIATYRRVVALAPDDEGAFERLKARYEDAEQWRALLGVLERKLETTEDPEVLVDLFGQIASLYLDHVRSDTQALPALERVLEIDPSNLEVAKRLSEIYRAKHDVERLYETYQRELPLLEGEERVQILSELGTIASTRLLRADEALKWWREVRALDPDNQQAKEALDELESEEGDWPALLERLEEDKAHAKTRKQRVEILERQGEIAYTRLGDEERARKIFAEITAIAPFNTTAHKYLRRIFVARRDWEDLRALYEPRDDWKGYLALLTEIAAESEDRRLVADIHCEIARVHEEREDGARKVRQALEAALEADGARPEVARQLLALYGDDEAQAQRRALALETVARYTDDLAEAAESWAALAQLRAAGGDAEGAFDAWRESFQAGAARGEVTALAELVRATEETSRWEDGIDALAQGLAGIPEEATQARIAVHRALAHMVHDRGFDSARAVTHFKWVLQLAPGDADALDALEEIYQSEGDLSSLEETLQARAESAADVAERHAAMRRLGRLYDDALGDVDRAAATYQAILEEEPEDAEALAQLRKTLTVAEYWVELAEALDSLSARVPGQSARDALRLEVAALDFERLQDAEAAVAICHELVRGQDGAQDTEATSQAMALLERIADGEQGADRALSVLEEAYRSQDDLPGLLGVLRRRGAHEGTPREERLAAYNELALLARAVANDPQTALEAQLARFDLAPRDPEIWRELMDLGAATGRWEPVLAAFRRGIEDAELVPPGDDRAALRLTLAQALAAVGDHEDERVAVLEAVIRDTKRAERYLNVFDELAEIYRERGDFEALARVELAASEAVVSDTARRARRLRAARIYIVRLERPREALPILRGLFDADPHDDEVAELLEAQYDNLDEGQALAELLQARIEALSERGDEATVHALRFDLALVRRDRLQDPASAVSELAPLVESEAVGDAARQALREIAINQPQDSKLIDRIVGTLRGYSEAHDDPHGQADALLLGLQRAKDGPPRARTLREAGGLYREAARRAEEAGDEGTARATLFRAFSLFARALHEYPADRDALTELESLAEALDAWDKLVQLLGAVAPKAKVPAIAHGLWERAAQLADDRLGDQAGAVAAWEKIVAAAKPSSQEAMRAYDALDRLYEALGRPEERVRVLRMKREAVRKPSQRLPLMTQEARLLESLERTDEAVEILEAVLKETRASKIAEVVEARKAALAHYSEILEAAGRYEELIALCESAGTDFAKIEPETAKGKLARAASVALERLQDTARATALYERVLKLDPADPTSLHALDGLYQAQERPADRARILEALVAASPEEEHEQRLKQLFTLGQLYEHRLEDWERGRQAYARALKTTPTFIPAQRAIAAQVERDLDPAGGRALLASAFRRAEAWEPLAKTLEAALAHQDAPSDETAAQTAAELAEILADRLHQPERALPHALQAYRLDPGGEEAKARRDRALELAVTLDATAEGGEAPGAVDRAVGALVEAAARLPELAERQARRREDAAAAAAAGASPKRVREIWRALLLEDPHDAEAIAELERAAAASGDVSDRVDLLEIQALAAEDPATRRALREEAVGLLLQSDEHREDAARMLELMLEDDPGDRDTFTRLAALREAMGQFEELAELLERRRGICPPEERAELDLRLGRTWAQGLEDPERGVEFYARVLEGSDEEAAAEAARALDALWRAGEARDAIFPALGSFYRDAKDAERLVALLTEALRAPLPALSEDVDARVSALQELAALCAKDLDDQAAAYEATKQLVAARAARGDEDLDAELDELEAFASRGAEGASWRDVAGTYDALNQGPAGTPDRLARAARIYAEHMGDAEAALTRYRAALAQDPRHAAAREAVAAILREGGRWDELADHLGAQAEATLDAQERARALREQATLLRETLGRPQDAVAPLQSLVELTGAREDYATLADLYEELGDPGPLEALLRAWIEGAPTDDEARAVAVRLASVAGARPEGVARAAEELDKILAAAPGFAPAVAECQRLLERAESWESSGERLAPAQAQALGAVAALVEGHASSDTPVDEPLLVRAKLRLVEDPEERGATCLALSALYEEAHSAEAAVDAALEALALLGPEPHVMEVVDRLITAPADQERAWEVLRDRARSASDGDAAAASFLAGGLLLADKLGRPADAVAPLERALAARPDEREAIERLATWYEATDQPQEEARVLALWLPIARDAQEKLSIQARLGVLRMDHQGDEAGALEMLRACLPQAAQDPDLRRRLETLLSRAGAFDELVAVYDLALEGGREAGADPDGSAGDEELSRGERVKLLAKRAQLEELKLKDLDRAAASCEAILALEPQHRFALTSLLRVERQRERWEAAEILLGRLREILDDEAKRTEMQAERGLILATHLGQPAAALELLTEADEAAGPGPGPEPLVQGLLALLDDELTRSEAARLLEPRLAVRRDWEHIGQVLAVRAREATSPEEIARLGIRRAELTFAKAQDPEGAIAIAGEALVAVATAPEHADKLRKLLSSLGKRANAWGAVCAVAEEVAKAHPGGAVAREHLLWEAQIQRGGLQDPEGAAETLRRVLSLDPHDAVASRALEAIYRQLGERSRLAELLALRAEGLDPAERVPLLLELATLKGEGGDAAEAVAPLAQVLSLDPDNGEAWTRLRGLLARPEAAAAAAEAVIPALRAGERWVELVEALEARAGALPAGADRVGALEELGDLCAERLGQPQRALPWYVRAAEEGGAGSAELLSKLGRVAHKLGAWTDLARALRAGVERAATQEDRRRLLLQLSQVAELRLGDASEAVARLEDVLAIDEYDRAALVGLVRLHRKLREGDKLLVFAERAAAVIMAPEDQLGLWRDVYAAGEDLGDRQLMIRACEASLEVDPYNAEASGRLVPLYQAERRFDELAELLARRAEVAESPEEEASTLMALGLLRDSSLKDVDGAIDAFERALRADPKLPGPAVELTRHYRELELWDKLVQLLELRTEHTSPPDPAWLQEAAAIAEGKLGDHGRAVTLLERLRTIAPEREEALDELIRLSHRHGLYERLAALYEAKAEREDSAAARLDLLVLAAETYSTRLGDDDRAMKLLQEVRAASPGHTKASALLARIRAARGEVEAAEELLRDILRATKGPARFEALVNLGRLYFEQRGDAEMALRPLLEAQSLRPDDADLRALMEEVLEKTGNWEELERVLQADYAAATTRSAKREAAIALATLHRTHLQDDEGFLRWVEAAREAGGEHPDLAELMIGYYRERGQMAEVVPRLEWLVNYLEAKKKTAALAPRAHELGTLLEKLGDDDKALEYYKMALSADGRYLPNLVDYGRLLTRRESWDKAMKVHQSLMMQSDKLPDPSMRLDTLYNLALAYARLGKKAKARQTVKKLLAAAPDHGPGQALAAEL